MKLTSAEANKMINQLRDEYRLILDQESNVVSFIAATTENIEDARPMIIRRRQQRNGLLKRKSGRSNML